MVRAFITVLAAIFSLAACGAPQPAEDGDPRNIVSIRPNLDAERRAEAQTTQTLIRDRGAFLHPVFLPDYPRGGYTYLTADSGHGYQVEYLSPDGRAFLWYDGNGRSLEGVWQFRDLFGNTDEICFAYRGPTINPVTGSRSGMNCSRVRDMQERIVGVLDGDPFNLQSGSVPAQYLNFADCLPPEPFILFQQADCAWQRNLREDGRQLVERPAVPDYYQYGTIEIAR